MSEGNWRKHLRKECPGKCGRLIQRRSEFCRWCKTMTTETRKKMALSKIGKRNPMFGKCDEEHHNWQGNNISYSRLHGWLTQTFGHPKKCSICGIEGKFHQESGRWSIQWALYRGKKYKRDKNNFFPACSSCHIKYDIKRKLKTKPS